MDAGARESLKQSLKTAVFVLSTVALIVWVVPSLVSPWVQSTPVVKVEPKVFVSSDEVDRFTQDILRQVAAVEVLSREDEDGIIRGIYQLPKGAKTETVSTKVRRLAKEADIELYASPVDGLDLEIRVYAGPSLRQQLLLVPDLPPAPRFTKGPRALDRPLLALIVTGLGGASADEILSINVPITVAVRPYTPFALRTARLAAESWHEVLVDVPKDLTPREAQGAVPLASGIWFDGLPVAPLHENDVVVVPADRVSGARANAGLRVLPAQRSDRRDAMATLDRARHIAARTGKSALIVDASDENLPQVLSWVSQAHNDGYRIGLASEAVRSEEVHGPSVSLDRR
ncbi:MAG: divergent polysaccharide deacetylase family protein [Myxococcota bacterium]